jgi:hypothetical protein
MVLELEMETSSPTDLILSQELDLIYYIYYIYYIQEDCDLVVLL